MEKEEEEKTAVRTPILNDEGKGREERKGEALSEAKRWKFSINSGSFCETTCAHFKEGKTSLKHSEIWLLNWIETPQQSGNYQHSIFMQHILIIYVQTEHKHPVFIQTLACTIFVQCTHRNTQAHTGWVYVKRNTKCLEDAQLPILGIPEWKPRSRWQVIRTDRQIGERKFTALSQSTCFTGWTVGLIIKFFS